MLDSRSVGYPLTSETKRLHIRPITLEDIPSWTKFMNDQKAIEFFPMFSIEDAETNAKNWIEKQIERYENGAFGLQAIEDKSNGAFLGQAGLLTQEINDQEELEIGYSFLSKHWGQGYATEAAMYFKQFVAQHRLSETIVSLIHEDNHPSKRVAMRNGMKCNESGSWKGLPIEIFRINTPSSDLLGCSD